MAEWPPQFTRPGALSLGTENKPYIESLDEVEDDDDENSDLVEEEIQEEGQREPDEEGSDIGKVMRYGQGPGGCLPQATKVEDFCQGVPNASLTTLRSGSRGPALPAVAWLHERGCRGARSDKGPLTANGLYKCLREPRFRLLGPNRSSSPSTCPTWELRGLDSERTSSSEIHQEEPDAERRWIFITDLDPWSILALIGTASKNQIPHLQAAIYKHLVFEPSFGFDIPPDGHFMFRLAFYLPYYALRVSKEPRNDPRMYGNGNPLRGHTDISFLESKHSELPTFLYEAQISCVVAGSDEWTWIAYCFVDTYFDAEHDRETVSSYYKTGSVDQGITQDPLTRGLTLADGNFQNPREYFLTVMRYRLEQIQNEWTQVVDKLNTGIREQEQILLSGSRRPCLSKSRDFVTKVQLLSKKLLFDLSNTVDSCEEFCRQPALDFQSASESTDRRPLLNPIRSILNELRLRKKTLESMADKADNITKALEVHLNTETIQVGHLSVTTMLFISPIALAAGIFSMNDRVIPIPLNFRSFLCILLAFGAMAFVIHLIQSDRLFFPRDMVLWARHMCWEFKLPVPDLRVIRLPRLPMVGKSTGKSPEDEESRGDRASMK
ncbi:uncharacterized protein Z518_07527 [Rhinocladiella mackenziei CBS 650.93]|uniref:Rhinocladiella mackenziei CBS 650.93 unplaced genomic scaffold supercont1.5, whole genome shotgun sequence n=1 Tax=Rhinocladiella mackenziei CBS 650.93 TaxID=1442369 RepID=A0A0D2IDT7_9EURO|nr:uncharacterized protein Z518_07527 [Rhinocladiella mackenziei CBS 650.93]KIX03974.1 hypothetical protein Z518_07527 [Rhinocladiella mackenziei CBS 650.93]